MTSTPAMYPTWVFYLCQMVSVALLLAALASVYCALTRRWALTRRLGRLSFLGGLGVFAVAILLVILPPVLGVQLGPDAESKATHLARGIAELMNTTVFALPGLLIGVVTWPLGSFVQRRRTRDAP